MSNDNTKTLRPFWARDRILILPFLMAGIFVFCVMGFLSLTMWDPYRRFATYEKVVIVLCWIGMMGTSLFGVIATFLYFFHNSFRLWFVQFVALSLCVICSLLPMGIVYSFVYTLIYEHRSECFDRAVQNGDGSNALYYAKKLTTARLIGYERDGRKEHFQMESNIRLGIAHELNGEFEKSLDDYQKNNEDYSYRARVLYKQKKYARAFIGYCKLADLILAFYEQNGHIYTTYTRPLPKDVYDRLGKQRVLFFDGERKNDALVPFADGDSFLRFINEEYEKMGSPKGYVNAVEFWRTAVKADISKIITGRLQQETPVMFYTNDRAFLRHMLHAECYRRKENSIRLAR